MLCKCWLPALLFSPPLLFCLTETSFLTSPYLAQIVLRLCLKGLSVCTERLNCPFYKGEMHSEWGTSKARVGDKCLYLESASALIPSLVFESLTNVPWGPWLQTSSVGRALHLTWNSFDLALAAAPMQRVCPCKGHVPVVQPRVAADAQVVGQDLRTVSARDRYKWSLMPSAFLRPLGGHTEPFLTNLWQLSGKVLDRSDIPKKAFLWGRSKDMTFKPHSWPYKTDFSKVWNSF